MTRGEDAVPQCWRHFGAQLAVDTEVECLQWLFAALNSVEMASLPG